MTSAGAHILSIGTAVPRHRGTQAQALAFFSEVLRARAPEKDRAKLLRYLESVSTRAGISTRYTVLPDYLATEPSAFEFFPRNWGLDPFPGTARRMKIYKAESPGLARRAAEAAFAGAPVGPSAVTHLLVTSCTGFFAPGLDICLVESLGLSPSVARTLIGFMGCQAGFNAMRTADDIIRARPDAVVLQVSIELCTLHLQADPKPEVLVANSLFGDGAAAVLYGSGDHPEAKLRVLGQASRLELEGRSQMTWEIGDQGFSMFLDGRVPDSIGPAAREALRTLTDGAGWSTDRVRRFAVHPGGPRILQAVERALELSPRALDSARAVLRDYGNMSSASIFFVLAEELAMQREPGPMLALGFGPGLSIEAALLEAL